MVARMAKVLVLLVFLAFGAGIIALGVLFIVSDGDVTGFVQTSIIRLRLAARTDDLNTPAGFDPTVQRFTVNAGDTPAIIARNLTTADIIIDADLFVDYVRVEGLDKQLEAGTYFLSQTQIIPEIALLLTDSRSSSITFRVFEGMRIEEIAAVINTNPRFGFTGEDFLAVVGPGAVVDPNFAAEMGIPTGASLEGFMFPDTYILPPDITAVGLRDTLLDAFREAVTPDLIHDAAAQGLSMFELVTLASIVERESVHNDENARIASVYRNRLEIGMRLDADPTVQYGLQGTRDSTWWPQITQADYQNVISPYNTYRTTGLPPGPIASPSLPTLRGTLYPETTNYFYFRARCDGSGYHNFAVTYEEHLANAC